MRKRHIVGPPQSNRSGQNATLWQLLPIVFLAVEIAYNAPQLIPDGILVSGGIKIQKHIQDCGIAAENDALFKQTFKRALKSQYYASVGPPMHNLYMH